MDQRVDHLLSRSDSRALILLNCCDDCKLEFDDSSLPLCDMCAFRVESLVRLCHSRPVFAIEFEEGSWE
jgi:hypothetical protein